MDPSTGFNTSFQQPQEDTGANMPMNPTALSAYPDTYPVPPQPAYPDNYPVPPQPAYPDAYPVPPQPMYPIYNNAG